MITRRKLLVALGASALIAPLDSFAQQQGKVWRIGVLHPNSPATSGELIEAFTQRLQELGYVEGKNIVIERRFADGNVDRLPPLAAELTQHRVDVILASNATAAQAAKQATSTIPIVFATVGDPVGIGLVATLAHPGGNLSGTTVISSDLSAKRLQLLKEAFPRISRVAIFTSPGSPSNAHQISELQRASKVLGLEILLTQLVRREEFKQEFALLRKWRADSIYVIETSTNTRNRKLLAEFAAQVRLPAIYVQRQYADDGGLISYGVNYEELYRRAAIYVDKILKGANPADLPVEQPTKFELVVNMKTAKVLGIKVSPSILVRADKVIE